MNTFLGFTAVKRRVKRELGVSQIEAVTRPPRVRQRVKERLGLYSPVASTVRQTLHGKIRSLFGWLAQLP